MDGDSEERRFGEYSGLVREWCHRRRGMKSLLVPKPFTYYGTTILGGWQAEIPTAIFDPDDRVMMRYAREFQRIGGVKPHEGFRIAEQRSGGGPGFKPTSARRKRSLPAFVTSAIRTPTSDMELCGPAAWRWPFLAEG